ncbi:hypothetical protein FJTKL_15117 [Diaporthe vaccinii]|uniref:Tat pathway signal sequence n=1 Tax=Diaporthe vaccinii TaxID=105482 RepID=A0ABR4E620_9PEZI
MKFYYEKTKGITFNVVASTLFGIIVGSTLSQFVFPRPDWRTCRQIGLEASAAGTGHASDEQWNRSVPQDKPHSFELLHENGYPTDLQTLRTLGTHDAFSPFKGPPTKEVDEAWSRYWQVWMFSIGEDAFKASVPQHSESAVRVHDKKHDDGSASPRYLATFEATHQLHCLYNLFRASYLDYYPDEKQDYNADPAQWHARVDHCVDILRQKLTCDRDTSLITYNWVKGKKGPSANFNVQRVCPRWEHLDEWAAKYEVTSIPAKPEHAVQLDSIP